MVSDHRSPQKTSFYNSIMTYYSPNISLTRTKAPLSKEQLSATSKMPTVWALTPKMKSDHIRIFSRDGRWVTGLLSGVCCLLLLSAFSGFFLFAVEIRPLRAGFLSIYKSPEIKGTTRTPSGSFFTEETRPRTAVSIISVDGPSTDAVQATTRIIRTGERTITTSEATATTSSTTTNSAASPASSTSDTTSTSSTTRKSAPIKMLNKPLTNHSMICTVDCETDIDVLPDGVCDFILYDSLYKCRADVGLLSLGEGLEDFIKLAAASKFMEYGCSIDIQAVTKFVEDLSSQHSNHWITNELLNKNVHHWGVTNAHKVFLDSYPGLLMNALEALKEAASFSRTLLEQRRIASYTFLGCYGDCQLIAEGIKAVFLPDAIVILGHISFHPHSVRKYITDFRCLMLPPNIYTIPDNVRDLVPYAHTYYEGCRLAECLRSLHEVHIPIAVSFTLKGRLWQPRSDDENVTAKSLGDYGLFKDCDPESADSDLPPAAVCSLTNTNLFKNMVWDKDTKTMASFDTAFLREDRRVMFAFDNHVTYRQKLCDAKRNLTQVVFTLAAFDVNFDSTEGTCPDGKLYGYFNRTLMLKKLSAFLENNYTDSSKHRDCLDLI
ncbi:uncharacterized protein LOC144102365 [Amblyomma americanum]